MTFKKMLVGQALCLAVSISILPINASAADSHLSQVSLSPQNDAGVSGDVDGAQGIIALTGQPLQAHITYQIGWYSSPPGGGTLTLTNSDISDPDYTLLFNDSDQNPSVLPAGVSFDPATGVLSGTPTVSGVWKYYPTVRDKQNGESPYRGRGAWWTEYTTYEGKTWIEAKDKTPLMILPAPSGKEVMLQCGGQMTAAGAQSYAIDILAEVDYERGIVKIIGNDGKTAGVYHATITDDFIAWGNTNIYNKPTFMASSVKIDRKTGTITTTTNFAGASTLNGNCQKRSTVQKF